MDILLRVALDVVDSKETYTINHYQDPTNIEIIQKLIRIYIIENNYEEALKYCIKGFNLLCGKCTLVLLNYYQKTLKNLLVMDYFKLALEKEINFDICEYFHILIKNKKTQLLEELVCFMMTNYSDKLEITISNYYIDKKYENFKTICSIGLNHQNIYSMKALGTYYRDIEPNEELMLKYYSLCLTNGCTDYAYTLGKHYYHKNDFEKMYGYFKMGINKLNFKCSNALGNYYFYHKKYDEAEQLYLVGVKNKDCVSNINLGNLYFKAKNDYSNGLTYLLNALELCNFSNVITMIISSINRIIEKVKNESILINDSMLNILSIYIQTLPEDKSNIILDIKNKLESENIVFKEKLTIRIDIKRKRAWSEFTQNKK